MQPSLNVEVIASTTRGSFEGMRFPEVIERLSAIGVERYYTDLVRAEKTFYGSNGESHREPFLTHWSARPAAMTFDPHAISDALRRIQRGEIDYPRFLECITAAGCAFYTVHLEGRKTIYTGRHGESYVEMFPLAK